MSTQAGEQAAEDGPRASWVRATAGFVAGDAGRVGDSDGGLIDGEVIQGEFALDSGLSGFGLITSACPA